MTKHCVFMCVFGLIALSFDDLTQDEKHASTCPTLCAPCQRAVDKALKFIVSKQKEDGRWEWEQSKIPPSQIWADVAMTSFNGLALHAAALSKKGMYDKEVQTARDWLVRTITKRSDKGSFADVKNLRGFTRTLAMAAVFLCHVYQSDKSQETRLLLDKLLSWIDKGQDKELCWYYADRKPGMVYEANLATVALILLRSCGLNVEEDVYQKVRKFYTKLQNKDGGFPYYVVPKEKEKTHELHMRSEAGRTAAAVLAMHLLGVEKAEVFQKARKYFEDNYQKVGHSQHGPAFHLFFATLASRVTDEKLARKFWLHYRDEILKGQKEDGSMAMKPPDGANAPIDEGDNQLALNAGGRVYSTCFYVLMFQLWEKDLLFCKMEPLETK